MGSALSEDGVSSLLVDGCEIKMMQDFTYLFQATNHLGMERLLLIGILWLLKPLAA